MAFRIHQHPGRACVTIQNPPFLYLKVFATKRLVINNEKLKVTDGIMKQGKLHLLRVKLNLKLDTTTHGAERRSSLFTFVLKLQYSTVFQYQVKYLLV